MPVTPEVWFRDDAQLDAVRAVLEDLADESDMAECRVVMKLCWQLTAPHHDVSMHEILTAVSAFKLRKVGELLVAMANGHEAIDEWVGRHSSLLPTSH